MHEYCHQREIWQREWEQSPTTNANPVLNVDKNGYVLYSNAAGEPLLNEWDVRAGEKLPLSIVDLVQRVISRNSPEKLEIKVGNKVYLFIFSPLPDQECVNVSGFDISDQKELEEKLRDSERRLSEAQRITHVGNLEWDIVENKMYRSDELYRIFGLNPREFDIPYGTLLKCIHPADRIDLDNAIIDTLNGNLFENDYRIILADGEERIAHVKGDVIFDEKNRPIRLRGTVQDITELRKSEERIRNLANIIESSNDAICTISLDGIITSWNKSAEQIYGYSAKDVVGKSITIVTPPRLSKETKKLIELIKQGERIHQIETIRLGKNGKKINVSLNYSPVFDVSGKLTAVSVIARDITESKKVEEKLRSSEEKYRDIVETANEGISIINSEAIVTYSNKKLLEMLGYTMEEFVGCLAWYFVEDVDAFKRKLEKRRQDINESYELKLNARMVHLYGYLQMLNPFSMRIASLWVL